MFFGGNVEKNLPVPIQQKLVRSELTKNAYLRKKSKWTFRYFNNSVYFCKQEMRIYAEKVNGYGDKTRYSSEETH